MSVRRLIRDQVQRADATTSQGYRVRLTPQEKREIEQLADRARITVADAIRLGTRRFLLDVLEQEAA